jgi:hypothetical protein
MTELEKEQENMTLKKFRNEIQDRWGLRLRDEMLFFGNYITGDESLYEFIENLMED